MSGLPGDFPILFAQDQGGSGMLQTLILFLPMIVLLYFMILRPQQQQEKKRRAMIDALKKNDKVLTNGGIYGTVISVDANNDRVVLRVDDEKNVKLAFAKSSVARVIEPSSDKSAAAT